MDAIASQSIEESPSREAAIPGDDTVEVGRRSLVRHGSTFYAAHLLLGKREAEDVQLLYGFCRFIDDLVDEQPAADAVRDLKRVRTDISRGDSAYAEVLGYLEFCERHEVDPRVTEEFLAGVEQDLVQRTYATEADLVRYCFRVAGTVGLYMCSLFDVTSKRALPFAIDLGVGMQLTNICRDVIEDARRGRVYLPADGPGGELCADELAKRDPAAVARARETVAHLLAQADRYYQSADAGMGHLPARARLAVLAASRCYQAIGPRVLAHSSHSLPDRAHVNGPRKALHFARAIGAAGRVALGGKGAVDQVHCADLHTALRDKPGANQGPA